MFTLESLAKAYARAPLYQVDAVESYRALANQSVMLARHVRRKLVVMETDEAEPYGTVDAMFADIREGKLVVSRANSEHPIFTVDENVAFRLAHDYFGHYLTSAGFDWEGEREACNRQASYLTPLAFPAFVTECLGQTAYRVHYGHFTVQKVALLEF